MVDHGRVGSAYAACFAACIREGMGVREAREVATQEAERVATAVDRKPANEGHNRPSRPSAA